MAFPFFVFPCPKYRKNVPSAFRCLLTNINKLAPTRSFVSTKSKNSFVGSSRKRTLFSRPSSKTNHGHTRTKNGRRKNFATLRFRHFVSVKRKREVDKKKRKWDQLAKNASSHIPRRFQLVDRSFANFFNKKEHLSSVDISSFSNISGMPSSVLDALSQSFNFKGPTAIQKIGIPAILKRKSVLLTAETGTGKTLAFLIPIIHKLKEEEEATGTRTPLFVSASRAITPRCIIFAPSRELAHQIFHVTKILSRIVKLRAASLLAGFSKSDYARCISEDGAPVDILVMNPVVYENLSGKSGSLLSEKPKISTELLRHVVFDEADSVVVVDPSEREWISHLESLCSLPSLNSLVFVSATVSKPLFSRIQKELAQSISVVTTKDFHKPLDHLKQRFFKVALGGEAKASKNTPNFQRKIGTFPLMAIIGAFLLARCMHCHN